MIVDDKGIKDSWKEYTQRDRSRIAGGRAGEGNRRRPPAQGRRAGESPALSPRRVPRDDWSTSRTEGREMAAMAGSSTSRGKRRLFTPFPAVSQLLSVMQIHFRSHADIYTHFISLIYGILRHSGLSWALFQVLPVPEFYFWWNT